MCRHNSFLEIRLYLTMEHTSGHSFLRTKKGGFFVGKIRISEGLFYNFIRNLEFGCQKMTHYLLDDKLQKGRFTLCLWKNIRKS